MAAPTITTVIPTYRRPELLRRAVHSALNQTYPHVQVLVLDNASGDNTGEVVAELARQDARVKYIRHPENIGAWANFQAGYAAVDSEFFSFLSDDDILMPHFYAVAMEDLRAHPTARMFCGQVAAYHQADGSHRLTPRRAWENRLYAAGEAALVMADAHFIWTSCVFATAIRDTVGPLDNTETLDHSFLLKASACFPLVARMVPCALLTLWDSGISSIMSIGAYIAAYTAEERVVTEHGRLTPAQLEIIRAHLADKLQRVVERKLRTAFDARDWESVAEAAEFLQAKNALTGRLQLRAWLAQPARRGGLIDRLFRRWLNWHQTARQTRKQQKQKRMSAEAVMALYAQPSPATIAGGEDPPA